MFIPPLRVVGFAEGTIRGTNQQVTYFIGTPLGPFRATEHKDSRFSEIRAIRFFNDIPELQPPRLLDESFVDHLKQIGYSVGVWVEGTVVEKSHWATRDIIDNDIFFYIGAGMIQIFVPGRGFPQEWPESFRWLDEVKKRERELLVKSSIRDRMGGD